MTESRVKHPKAHDGTTERTFLIADVRGYTSYTRQHGDAAAARLAQRFAALANEAVEARGGRVVELRGDETLAVFASQAAAVRAATDLVAVCADEAAAHDDLPLHIGVGVDAGEAVAVDGGFRGSALNKAARLCSQAKAGQVFVSSEVAEQAKQLPGVRYVSRGEAELKGFDAPVQLIEAVVEDGRRPPTGEAPVEPAELPLPLELELETPIVGRERELAWLRGLWRQARRGYGASAFVSGAPQIGKTRLVAELASLAAAQGAAVKYVGAGGAGPAAGASAVRELSDVTLPTLLILDDLDALGAPVVASLHENLEAIEAKPVLVLAAVRAPEGMPEIGRLFDGHGVDERQRTLTPLDADEIHELARFYASDPDDLPLESIARASGGVPGRAHELMVEWAEQEASRRLSAAAEWIASERTSRAAGLDFANTVIGAKLSRLSRDQTTAEAIGAGGFCPYKGLASFEEEDARFFFGRERLAGELAARTVGVGLLAVVGPSGSGKSSLIAAGLLPSLAGGLLPGSERWRLTVIRPGEHPVSELDRATREGTGGGRQVIVIDQFEELFTLGADEAERDTFVDALVARAQDPETYAIVLSLRGDFIDACAPFPRLAELVSANQVLVGPMTDEELRRAIELPARRTGLRIERALVDTLVDEVADEPGALPLLSTTLVELWQNRSDGWMQMAAYERTGGVRGAVARLAETTYEQLDEKERATARTILLRLVAGGAPEAFTRRRVPLDEFDVSTDPVAASVLDRLTTDRLLTRDESTVEVAHEALLREWPRLQGWLAEDAQGRELRLHMTQAARQWQERGRDDAELYRGTRLSAAADWAATHAQELNQLERDFLATSRRASERALRRLRVGVAVLAVLLLAAIAAGAIALVLRSQAQHEATVATVRELANAADSNLAVDPERSLLLALQAVAKGRGAGGEAGVEAAAALHRAVDTSRVRLTLRGHVGGVVAATATRRGDTIATVGIDRTLRLWNAATGKQVRTIQIAALTPRAPVTISFSPDGRRIAAPDGNVAGIWDARTGKRILTLKGHTKPVQVALYNPDGTQLATTAGDFTVRIWSARSGRLLRTIPNPRADASTDAFNGLPYATLAYSPDGRRLFGGYDTGVVHEWNVATGRVIRALHVSDYEVESVAVSPDGKRLAIGSGDAIASVWSARTGRLLYRDYSARSIINGVDIDPSGRMLATASADGMARIFDLATGRLLFTLAGHPGMVMGVHFTSGGRTVVTAGDDGTARVWDVSPRGSAEWAALPMSDRVFNVAYSPTGKAVATSSVDGKLALWTPEVRKLWSTSGAALIGFAPGGRDVVEQVGQQLEWQNVRTRRIDRKLSLPRGNFSGALSPDGRRFASGFGSDGPGNHGVDMLDTSTGKRLVRIGGFSDLEDFTFSPDGRQVAIGGDHVAVFDARTGTPRYRLKASFPSGVLGVKFSPDGRLLVTGEGNGTARVWSARDGGFLYALKGHTAFVKGLAFSPDGKTLATGSYDSTIKLWNVSDFSQPPLTLQGHTAAVYGLVFSPDGRRLLSGSRDTTARVDAIDVGDLVKIARTRLTRSLTTAECQQYLHRSTCPR